MRKCLGLTESVWTTLPEDKRISWKYFARVVAIVGAFLVTKTGNAYFDTMLSMITALFFMIVIETQRSYSKLRPSFRKRNIRIAIALGSWGVTILGVAIFSQAFALAAATVLSSDVFFAFNHSASALKQAVQAVTLLVFLIALLVAVVHTFRQLNVEELVYKLPRDGLKQLLVHKQPKATSFELFACMELSVLVACLMYASSVAEVANVFLRLVRSV